MALLPGAVCGVRHDSCFPKHRYVRTSHWMASDESLSKGVDLFFAREFCFFKQEHGLLTGSKQTNTDVLLTTVLGPPRRYLVEDPRARAAARARRRRGFVGPLRVPFVVFFSTEEHDRRTGRPSPQGDALAAAASIARRVAGRSLSQRWASARECPATRAGRSPPRARGQRACTLTRTAAVRVFALCHRQRTLAAVLGTV